MQNFKIILKVKNSGRYNITGFNVTLFEDINEDGEVQNSEIFEKEEVSEIAVPSDSSVEIEAHHKGLYSGIHFIGAIANHQLDQNHANDMAIKEIKVKYRPNSIAINEIMYNPFTENDIPGPQSEYIEIINISENPIYLKNWKISDSNILKKIELPSDSTYLKPDEFLVISEDSSIINFFKVPGVNLIALQKNFPDLGNSMDMIIIYDPSNTVIDSVNYSSKWGGERGVSLERINPFIESNNRMNWGSNILPAGGTPGYRNSIFTPLKRSKSSLSAHPNPFSPDSDGFEDVTFIEYSLPFIRSRVNLSIFDVTGRMVKRLLNNNPGGSSRIIPWDGRDERGNPLRIGIYIILLDAYDLESGKYEKMKSTVVLARRL
jgi:hypothetical protein